MTVVLEKIDRPALNIAFAFPSGESAYSFFEPTLEVVSDGPEAVFIMMKADDYNEFQAIPGGETPPSMSLFIFPESAESVESTNLETDEPPLASAIRLRNWAEANSAFTLFNRARSAAEETEIDGVEALHYKAEGQYKHDTYAVLYRGRYYLFVGQYQEENDSSHLGFISLMQTVTFY